MARRPGRRVGARKRTTAYSPAFIRGALDGRAGLQGIPQWRSWRKKASEPRPNGTRNHLVGEFQRHNTNTKWVTDITYIRTAEHGVYLCIVLDLYSGLVVGWSRSPQQNRQL